MNKELEKMKYGGYGDLLISKQNEIETLQQELQRKDNIINEIKKYLEKKIARGRSKDNIWLMGCYDEDREILDKINELEGENENK